VPALRSAVQSEVESTATSLSKQLSLLLRERGSVAVCQQVQEWLSALVPLSEAWLSRPTHAPLVWNIVRRVFDALIDKARSGNRDSYEHALELAAALPAEGLQQLPPDAYLEAIIEIATALHQDRADIAAAAVMLHCGLQAAAAARWDANHHVLYKSYELLGRLYQELALPYHAYEATRQARGKATSPEQRKVLGQRLAQLDHKPHRDGESAESQEWEAQQDTVLARDEIARWLWNAQASKSRWQV
jgi:hypothetical protein